MKRMAAIIGILAVGAIGGLIGQASGAHADTAQRRVTTTSSKTLYAQADLNYSGGVADAPATGTPTTVLRIRVSAPSAGTAAVSFDTQYWTDFPSNPGSASPLFAFASIGRCSAVNTLSASVCKSVQPKYTQKAPYSSSSSDVTEPYSISALIPFARSGTKTLSLTISATGYPSGFYGGAHTQVAFTPAHAIATSSHITLSVFQ